MKILIFVIGVIIGSILRNIVEKIIKIKRKIDWAEEKCKEEQKRLEFKNKHDFGDSFDENIDDEKDGGN